MTSMITSSCDLTGTFTYDPFVQVLWNFQILVDPEAPIEADIMASTTLNDPPYHLTDILGWAPVTETVADPPWLGFSQQRMGIRSIEQAQLGFAADRSGNDIRSLLMRGDEGTIYILPSGTFTDAPAAPLHAYPVKVSEITPVFELRGGRGAILTVSFVILREPGINVFAVDS